MGEKVRYFHSIKKGVHRVWIDHPWFLAKVWGKTGSKLYGPRSGADYLVRGGALCMTVLAHHLLSLVCAPLYHGMMWVGPACL